jgi:hypothetical protein
MKLNAWHWQTAPFIRLNAVLSGNPALRRHKLMTRGEVMDEMAETRYSRVMYQQISQAFEDS